MPELPEVETTRRGIEPYVRGHTVEQVHIRQPKLRWPVTRGLSQKIRGRQILDVARRGKYLLLRFEHGTLMIHLGMSGSLRIVSSHTPADKHDHVDLCLEDGHCLRFHDPRRFGAILWTSDPVDQHELIQHLGPEPLSDDFSAEQLYRDSRKRKITIKNFIMNCRQVVGVGNIYASEALFLAGIRPGKAAGKLSRADFDRLADSIRKVLSAAIKQGGTTLRDFVGGDGKPGYFSQQLQVYGREGQPCHQCGSIIKQKVIGQRSSYYCPQCQK